MPHKDLKEYRSRPHVKKMRCETQKRYYLKNREKYLEYYKVYNKTRPNDFWKYKSKQRDVKREYNKRYFKQNPEAAYNARAKRRLRLGATVEDPAAIAEFVRMIRQMKWVMCRYCRRKVRGKDVHIDHVVPVSKGGHHKVENLSPSCGPCNLSKKDKLITEWKPDGHLFIL